MIFVNLLLGLVAFRSLLGIGVRTPATGLEAALDSWFFVPTDMSPGVVVAMSAWLFYRRRAEIFSLPRERGPLGGVALLLGLAAASYAWATLARVPDLLAVPLIFSLLGFALLHCGRAGLRAALLPAGVLLFALPIPAPLLNEIVYRFQIWSADYAGWILFQMGLPGFVAGDQIVQASKRFVVIESCSGLRSVETLTMLAILLIDLFRRRGLHAAVIVVSAPFVAFALNGFRVVGLILNPHSRVAAIHTLQGVAILLAGLVLLYLLDGLLARARLPGWRPRPLPTASGKAAASAFVVPVVLVGAIAASLLLPSWVPPPAPGQLTSRELAGRIDEFRGTDLGQSKIRFFLGTIGLRESLYRRYRVSDRGNSADLFVGFGMHTNRYRSPLSPKTALPGSGWEIEDERTEVIDGRSVQARVLRSGTRRILSWSWYENSQGLWRETWRNLLALDRTPWRRDADVLAVRLSTQLEGPTEAQRREGGTYLEPLYHAFRAALRPAGAVAQQ